MNFGDPKPVLDFQGECDGRTWITQEKALEMRVQELESERDFLRLMLEQALASNQDSGRDK